MPISKLVVSVFPPRLLIRYVTVGATSALAELFLFYAFVTWLDFPLMVANIAAVCSVTLMGFLAQKHFTFHAGGLIAPQAMLYGFQVGINFLLNNVLVFLFGQILQFRPLVAKILQLALCFVFNFCFSRFVVFGSRIAGVRNSNSDAS